MLGILNLNLRSLNITGKKEKSLMAVVIFPSTAVLDNHLVPNYKTKIADLRVEIVMLHNCFKNTSPNLDLL